MYVIFIQWSRAFASALGAWCCQKGWGDRGGLERSATMRAHTLGCDSLARIQSVRQRVFNYFFVALVQNSSFRAIFIKQSFAIPTGNTASR
jgi:hypothetical protein